MRDLFWIEGEREDGTKRYPNVDDQLEIHGFLKTLGFGLLSQPEKIFLMSKVGDMIREYGPTKCLSFQDLNESVLPANTPRHALRDTLRFHLSMLEPSSELLLIDHYLFPIHPDPGLLGFMQSVLEDTLKAVSTLHVVTQPGRNTAFEAQFHAMAQAVNPTIAIHPKYTGDFHDRFWLTDQTGGLFVGASMNGIGNRYALVDWLREEDATAIYSFFQSLP